MRTPSIVRPPSCCARPLVDASCDSLPAGSRYHKPSAGVLQAALKAGTNEAGSLQADCLLLSDSIIAQAASF